METLSDAEALKRAAGYIVTYWEEIEPTSDQLDALHELFVADPVNLEAARLALAKAWTI